MSELEPGTREEMLLAGILNGDTTTNIEPADRKERLLKAILENGGKALPEVSGSDNGKVLGVVDGEWDATEIPEGNMPAVTASDAGKVLRVGNSGNWGASALDDFSGKYKTISQWEKYKGQIISNGTWDYTSNANYLHVAIPVSGGDHVVMHGNASRQGNYAALTAHTTPLSGSASFSAETGWTGRKAIVTNGEASFNLPSDAKYLYIQTFTNGNDCTPALLTINGYQITSDSIMGSAIEYIDNGDQELNLKKVSNYEVPKPFPNSGYLTSNGGTGSSTKSVYTDYIPIEDSCNGITYCLSHVSNAVFLIFYDESKTVISGSGIEGSGSAHELNKGTAAIPTGAKYFRAGQWIDAESENYYVRKTYAIQKIASDIDDLNIRADVLELRESVNKPFAFSGKKITAFGDSITQGTTSPGLTQGTPYIKHFADHVGATLSNQAVSGQKIASDTQYSIYTKITSYTDTTDFIVVAGGTNDYNTGVELGTYESTAGVSTFYGALKAICTYLQTNYPDTPVIFITPIPYTDIAIEAHNSAGYTLNDYRKAIYEIATLYGFSVVSGAALGMPTEPGGWNNTMCDDADGCHPTAEGHKLMARSLAGKLC